eukprot:CAMPEP_0177666936 /NCGR_PEP_ID=MMETSP0447-20121125/21848_1 /TAXON_ID=0 /ORGANISM="Stygamoeba regulata, Strain BSH-02190019" /LENGTH=232 /DNA_ID=CAMNT_0019173119 /DNA_START=30 /DNA_END=726 /DNA_ORIENTATION=+
MYANLVDVAWLDRSCTPPQFRYINEVPFGYLKRLLFSFLVTEESEGCQAVLNKKATLSHLSDKQYFFILYFDYGHDYKKKNKKPHDPFNERRAAREPKNAHLSNFLHPIIRCYKWDTVDIIREGRDTVADSPAILPGFRTHHVVEDFHTNWTVQVADSTLADILDGMADESSFGASLNYTQLRAAKLGSKDEGKGKESGGSKDEGKGKESGGSKDEGKGKESGGSKDEGKGK